MKHIFFLFILLGLLLMPACKESETQKAYTYGDDVKKALDDYKQSVQDLGQKVADNKAVEKLSGKNPDLREAATEWESRHKNITSSYADLAARFERVKVTSKAYFDDLDRVVGSIQDEGTRAQEQKKNDETRFNWDRKYKEAEISMQKLQGALEKGNDIHKVILLAGLREKIGVQINELTEITSKATVLLADLEKFTVEGKNILSLSSDEKNTKM